MTTDGFERPTLSSREKEVLRAWIISDSKIAVARDLFISPATVGTHIARIRDKYDAVGRSAGSKAALVARALQDGHVELGEL
ncbi:MAG: LuxR C-terminal-related transcriptional regulator [Rhodococcus sp. (in: high G+C Gram-positive bacteria)]